MKNNGWKVALALLAIVIGGTVALSYAQGAMGPHEGGWGGPMHGHLGWMAKELNLTDAQKQQIKTMMQAQHSTMKPVMQQLMQTRQAMLAATANGAFDQAKIQALASQQAQLMSQLEVQKQAMQHQIYTQVLTADQRTKAEELRQQEITRITEHLQKMSQAPPEAPAE